MREIIPKYKDEILLTQYQQVCEDFRQTDSLVWQLIPSFAAAIGGTLIVVVFSALSTAPVYAKIFVLCIAFLLTAGIDFIMMRHRYFQAKAVGTLSELERELGVKHIQRTPYMKLYDKYNKSTLMFPNGILYPVEPKSIWADGIPGPKLFFNLLLMISIGIIAIVIYILVSLPTCTSLANKIFSWIIFGLSMIIFSGSVLWIHLKEQKEIRKEKKMIDEWQKETQESASEERK